VRGSTSPDILCLQEIKCAPADLPASIAASFPGYHCFWSSADQKGYAGTAIITRVAPRAVTYGIGSPAHDEEGRTITAEFDDFFLVTAYVPNSGRGLVRHTYRTQEWDPAFRAFLVSLDKTKPVIMCGDLNVAHAEIDLANPKTNKKNAGFTPEEREGFTQLLAEGFVDSFRHFQPTATGQYSFWTYMGDARARNIGWRLDYFVVSRRFMPRVRASTIEPDVRGSDHCPVAIDLGEP
jgi:exodeoxyribonuclease III